jgi:hypothetical protein
MDEATLRARAEAWTLRAAEARDPRARAADLLIAAHYAALADLMAARVHSPPPTSVETEA